MHESIKMIRYECDACGREAFITENEDSPFGYHGEVMREQPDGGVGANWYACKQACIKQSVLKALAAEIAREEKSGHLKPMTQRNIIQQIGNPS